MVGPEPSNWRAYWLFQRRRDLPASTAAQKKRTKPPYVSQEELADELVAAGFEMDRPKYNKMEKGRLPISDDLLERLAAHFKVAVPEPPAEPRSDSDRLVDALAAQTKAINDLVVEMRTLARGQAFVAYSVGEIEGKVASVLARLGIPNDGPPQGPGGGRRRKVAAP